MGEIVLTIDRIMLGDLGASIDGEALAELLEVELGGILAQDSWDRGIVGGAAIRAEAPPLDLPAVFDATDLARGIAQSIAGILRSQGPVSQGG